MREIDEMRKEIKQVLSLISNKVLAFQKKIKILQVMVEPMGQKEGRNI